MNDQLSCVKCGHTVTGKETKCPQCGGWIRRAQRIRRLGFVLVGLGFFLVAMMGTITIMLAPMMLSAGQETSGAKFNGTPEQAFLVLGLFGIIIVFGLACIAGGLFQIVTGRRSILIIILVLVLTFAMLVAVSAVRKVLDRSSVPGRSSMVMAANWPVNERNGSMEI
jgi:MFS family permease